MHSEWYNSSVVQHQSLNADARHFFMDQTRIDTILTDLFQESWDSWEYTVTSEGFHVFRRKTVASHDLYEYKAIGIIPGVPADIAYQVSMDLEYRKQFSNSWNRITMRELDAQDLRKELEASELQLLSRDYIEWSVKFPWPFRCRNYRFERFGIKVSLPEYPHTFFIANDSIDLKMMEVPANNSEHDVQIEDYAQHCLYISFGDYEQVKKLFPTSFPYGSSEPLSQSHGNCLIIMKYFENSKMDIPVILQNWVIQHALPNSIRSQITACKKFQEDFITPSPHHQGKTIDDLADTLDMSLKAAFNF